MGGAVGVPGNITPCAEFNCYADAVAAARVFALTSPSPASTMPPPALNKAGLPAYPAKLSRPLKLTLFPLDITTPHELMRGFFLERIAPLRKEGSPLAEWTSTFLTRTFDQINRMVGEGVEAGLSLHDPLCIWYMLTRDDPAWKHLDQPEDIRIEVTGQWTRGMHVVDRRRRVKAGEGPTKAGTSGDPADELTFDEVPGDTLGWLSVRKGNRINRIVDSPGANLFAPELMRRVFE
ncbi:hypothetical protein VTK73DRAFT_5955 [Phialemonium thermophilum]|uniref:Inosine/uridine-preferring nucleoside hydrolase domain-containing protein n=1 Tax=Phialemonium thermophilum TaxID=223376 RepID=A0ABR3WL39_9PEZI